MNATIMMNTHVILVREITGLLQHALALSSDIMMHFLMKILQLTTVSLVPIPDANSVIRPIDLHATCVTVQRIVTH